MGDDVVWRATSEESTLDDEGLHELLCRIDSVADAIMTDPNAPSFALTDDGISICGLPSFTPSFTSVSETIDSPEAREGLQLDPEWSDIEKSIRKVLSLVSKVSEDEIRKDQTIFHLGLDSISAIKVCSLLRRQSIRLSVSELLRAATISNMAVIVNNQANLGKIWSTDTDAVLRKTMKDLDSSINALCASADIDLVRVEKVIPATPGQVYFLSVWQNTRGALFQSTFEYKWQGLLDKPRLDEAWRSLLIQSPILRSTFVATAQRKLPILQVVLKDYKPVRWLDRDALSAVVQGNGDSDLPVANLRAQYDSGVTLLQLDISHTLYDAISLPQIISYLQLLYDKLDSQITPQPRLDDFLALTLSGSDVSKRKKFWRKYLGSSTSLPTGSLRRTESNQNIRTEVFQPALFPSASHLERTARLKGVTFQSLFLAAYARAFATFLPKIEDNIGNANVIFGIYLANRSHPLEGLSSLAAPTVNIVPLKVTITPPSKSLIDIATRIQDDLQDISDLQNSTVSLWEIDDWTGIKINSTVNFLKLLVLDEDDGANDDISSSVAMNSSDGADNKKTKFHPVQPPEWNSGVLRRRRQTMTVPEFVDPVALKQNIIRDSYLVSYPSPNYCFMQSLSS